MQFTEEVLLGLLGLQARQPRSCDAVSICEGGIAAPLDHAILETPPFSFLDESWPRLKRLLILAGLVAVGLAVWCLYWGEIFDLAIEPATLISKPVLVPDKSRIESIDLPESAIPKTGREVVETGRFEIQGKLLGCEHHWTEGVVRLTSSTGKVIDSEFTESGVFVFADIDSGSATVELAMAPNHRSETKTIDVGSDLGPHDLQVHPYTSVEVKFFDELNRPLRSSRVSCELGSPVSEIYALAHNCGSPFESFLLDQPFESQSGSVSNALSHFDKQSGRLEIFSHVPLCVSAFVSRTPLDTQTVGADCRQLSFSLRKVVLDSSCGGVRGTVVDDQTLIGIQEKNAVGILNDPEASFYFLKGTDAEGAFQIDNLRSGTWTLLYEFDDYVRVTSPVVIKPGEITDVGEIALTKSTFITGSVMGPDGPVTNAPGLQIVTEVDDRGRFGERLSPGLQFVSNNGNFTAAYLEPGEHCISVVDSKWASDPVLVTVGDEPLRGLEIHVREGIPITIERKQAIFGLGPVSISTICNGKLVEYKLTPNMRETIALVTGNYQLNWRFKGAKKEQSFEVAGQPISILVGEEARF